MIDECINIILCHCKSFLIVRVLLIDLFLTTAPNTTANHQRSICGATLLFSALMSFSTRDTILQFVHDELVCCRIKFEILLSIRPKCLVSLALKPFQVTRFAVVATAAAAADTDIAVVVVVIFVTFM